MEKLQIVSQPNCASESLSTCDKQTQPPVRSVIFDFFATRLLWPRIAISNIVSRLVSEESLSTYDKQTHPPIRSVVFDFFATRLLWPRTAISNIVSRLINKNQEPPLALQHLFQLNESAGDSNGSFVSTLQEEISLLQEEISLLQEEVSLFQKKAARLNTISCTVFQDKKAVFQDRQAEEIALFQKEVARLNNISSTILQDENAKNNRSPEAFMVTFPIEKKFLWKALAIPMDSLSTYPPKIGQTTAHPRGTDTSLADFFLDKVTIPNTDLSFWDIVENRAYDSLLKGYIDEIMPMLCPSLSPYPNSDAPLLSCRLLHLIQTDLVIASKYLCGIDTILHFFGFRLNSNRGVGSIVMKEGYEACAAYVRQNGKQWQIYQLIRSLLACGFHPLGYSLRGLLLNISLIEEYDLSTRELERLTEQAFGSPTTEPLDHSDAAAHWEACAKNELALEDGIAFDQTLPPQTWASYQAHYLQDDPLYLKFEEGSPPLLVRKTKKERWYWHLPHLQTPFNKTPKKNLKNRRQINAQKVESS